MNKKNILILIIVVAVSGIYLIAKNQNKKELIIDKEVTIVEDSERDLILKDLSNKYEPISGWEKDLNYSIDAQEKLATSKPVLFEAVLEDIFKLGNKNYVRFSPDYFFDIDYSLELECDDTVVNKIRTEGKNNFFGSYAVIANISYVKKMDLSLNSTISDSMDVEIANTPSDLFILKGTCIDVVKLGRSI